MKKELLTQEDLLNIRTYYDKACETQNSSSEIREKYNLDLADLGVWNIQTSILCKRGDEKKVNIQQRLMQGMYRGIKFNYEESYILAFDSSLIGFASIFYGAGERLFNSVKQSIEPDSNLLEIIASSRKKFNAEKISK